jgi:drug/metabolite transporter (DMT)-like permease
MSLSEEPERRPSMDFLAVATMLFLTMAWGVNAVAGKIAVEGLDPMFLSFMRAILAGGAVIYWCRRKGIRIFERDGSLWSGLLVGLLFGLEFALIYKGLDLTSASRANLMVNTMPLFTLLGSHYLLGERASVLKIIGTVLSFFGVVVVLFDKLSMPSSTAVYGDLLCIAGGFAWAATAIAIRTTKVGTLAPEKTLLYQLLGAALVSAPYLYYSPELVRHMDWLVFGSLMFQSFFVVAFTYVIWFWLMTRYPLTGLSAFTFLSPVFGVLFSWLLLGEPLTKGLTSGLALIVAGLILVNSTFRRSKP